MNPHGNNYITQALATPPPLLDCTTLSEDTRETLEVFDVMRRMQTEVSRNAFGNYVISMTHTASHILEVMYLAWLTALPAGIRTNGFAVSASAPVRDHQ